MFRVKLLLILPLVVAVTVGQANRGEKGQWLLLSPARPMLVTGPVIAAPEAPVPIAIPASQPGEPVVAVPLSNEPLPTGEPAPVTEQPPASLHNVYYIIYLQYEPVVQPEPVTQYPPPTPMATPLLPKTQPVREPGVGPHQSSVPPMTSSPTGLHPSSFAVAPPQPSTISEPQPPVTEAAPLAPPVVVTTQSHPAVTQVPRQLIFEGQSKEGNGYNPVEAPIAPAPVIDGPSAPAAPPALAAPSYAPILRPRPLYTPVHRPLLPPRPNRPTPPAVGPPQRSAIGEPQPTVTKTAPLAPPVVVTTQSQPAVTQVPTQLIFNGQSKEGNGYNPVEAPIAPAPVLDGPSAPAALPALAAPSYAPILRPRPLYTPEHRPLLPPRPNRPTPPAVGPPERSATGEPQPPVSEAAPLAAPMVVTTQSHPAVTQAPGQLMFDFQCKEENGYYSVEHECDTYIECKQNRAMKYMCPGGLHFNPAVKYNEYPCAYPSIVKCIPGDQEQSPKPTVECPHEYGFYSMNDSDCSQYIRCHEGLATIMECPKGLAFNPQTSSCDWPANVTPCNPNEFLGFTCPTAPTSATLVNYKHPSNCYYFFSCESGRPRLLSCNEGLAFDPASGHCVDAEYVNCDVSPLAVTKPQ